MKRQRQKWDFTEGRKLNKVIKGDLHVYTDELFSAKNQFTEIK